MKNFLILFLLVLSSTLYSQNSFDIETHCKGDTVFIDLNIEEPQDVQVVIEGESGLELYSIIQVDDKDHVIVPCKTEYVECFLSNGESDFCYKKPSCDTYYVSNNTLYYEMNKPDYLYVYDYSGKYITKYFMQGYGRTELNLPIGNYFGLFSFNQTIKFLIN